MHAKHPGIDATWKQPIDGKYYVTVFLWTERQDVPRVGEDSDTEALGACLTFWAINNQTKQTRSGPKFGEIHLSLRDVSYGLVAHEIQHLVNYWMRFNWLHVERDDEKIAEFAENMTAQFWENFNRIYR